ncbi:hypothetical protein BCR32DRAFT_288114 [Anaeromyces robustus]|uniref:Periplasmic binding protein-like II n=1 Tax=Anaeromyces robustus TaxID=1754192 RepID=A0A1Y1VEE3_9FUNG|nr:hypothetical protein BCR32DRAFT_288114 [Anaeromyces robustus]|eukprot:ORX52872.1 hypothetical protein BCR32DRAFT_288114 [Anaeromyces robustus]
MFTLLYIIISVIFILIDNSLGRNITLNAVAYTFGSDDQLYSSFLKKFNDYSKKNNLNIEINLNLISPVNSSTIIKDYGSMIETVMKKTTNLKYHIYFYDNLYISKYGPYLLNIENYLPKEHIDMYDAKILNSVCKYKDELVGLPFSLGFSALYSNIELLKKYNKTIPRTWDELIKTSRYILDEEKKLNNTDLIGYNGLFSGYYSYICNLFYINI